MFKIERFAGTQTWRDTHQNSDRTRPGAVALRYHVIFAFRYFFIFPVFSNEHGLILTRKRFLVPVPAYSQHSGQWRWFWILVLSPSTSVILNTHRTDSAQWLITQDLAPGWHELGPSTQSGLSTSYGPSACPAVISWNAWDFLEPKETLHPN